MPARYAIAMTEAKVAIHPPIQPARGPIALVAQVNTVPQSGSARLSWAYPTAIAAIGKKARNMMAGACSPTAITTKPSVAVML